MPRRYLWLMMGALLLLLLMGAALYRVLSPRRQTQLVERAIRAIEAQQLEEAIALLRATLAQTPDDVQSRYLLAQTYHLQGDLEAALAELRRLPVDHQKAELVLVQMAGIYVALNRPAEAERTLRDCLARFPASAAARQYLLDVLGLQLREREMFVLLDDLWELVSSRPVMDRVWVLAKSLNLRFVKLQEEEVWPTLQAFARREPDNLHTRVAMAKLRLRMNADVVDAARTLETCLEQSPDHLEAIAVLAGHYVEHGGAEDERIEELLDRWSSTPGDAEYWQVLGDWQVRKGQLSDAMDSYRRARALDATQWRTLHKMGLLAIRTAKQSGDPDPSPSAEGRRLVGEAAALKELRARGSDHFAYLQRWLSESSPSGPPELKAPQIAKMVEIAAFCESVHCRTDALRWCDVIQQVAPREPAALAIRSRLTRSPQSGVGPPASLAE